MRLRLPLLLLLWVTVNTPAWAKDVFITSTPPGARVTADGQFLGLTPLKTTKKAIMPTWAYDGVPTSATVTIELPLHEPKSFTYSEFRVPARIDVQLERKAGSEYSENFLEQDPDLAAETVAAKSPTLQVTQALDEDAAALYMQGYVLVGYLGFSAEVVPMAEIRKRAESFGAALALVQSTFAGMQTELRQVTSRVSGGLTSSITFGSASGTANGTASGLASSAWNAQAYAQHTATSFGFTPGRKSTSFVPFARRQYDTQVTLWRKRARNPLGAFVDPLPNELRIELERNTGAIVIAIEDDSPAFFANLLVGDVIVGIGNREILRPSDVSEVAQLLANQTSVLRILRAGNERELSVAFD